MFLVQKKLLAILLVSIITPMLWMYSVNINNQSITLAFFDKNANLIKNVFVQLYIFILQKMEQFLRKFIMEFQTNFY
jgi:hypothetical protein